MKKRAFLIRLVEDKDEPPKPPLNPGFQDRTYEMMYAGSVYLTKAVTKTVVTILIVDTGRKILINRLSK